MAQNIFKDYLTGGVEPGGTKKSKPKGANSDAMILAILYLASKNTDAPAELKHISNSTGIANRSIRTCTNKLLKALPQYHATSGGACELVSRYGAQLNIPPSLITISQDVAKGASSHLEGKFPSTVASASILLSAEAIGYKIRAEDIAKVAGLTPTTVNNATKELKPHTTALLPKDWKDLTG
eukprot:TRINITY_DN2970_c0_g1_i4.p1 TRINITY_DN2970_c0_g1~~TRINITY_DN2970_c0_g1_i4.p1  ORF type:complete len:182 (-),score=36.65 TRINITY_DN2970_c0_g1_i4:348-893(-)